jgi:hypothetical protein
MLQRAQTADSWVQRTLSLFELRFEASGSSLRSQRGKLCRCSGVVSLIASGAKITARRVDHASVPREDAAAQLCSAALFEPLSQVNASAMQSRLQVHVLQSALRVLLRCHHTKLPS